VCLQVKYDCSSRCADGLGEAQTPRLRPLSAPVLIGGAGPGQHPGSCSQVIIFSFFFKKKKIENYFGQQVIYHQYCFLLVASQKINIYK